MPEQPTMSNTLQLPHVNIDNINYILIHTETNRLCENIYIYNSIVFHLAMLDPCATVNTALVYLLNNAIHHYSKNIISLLNKYLRSGPQDLAERKPVWSGVM